MQAIFRALRALLEHARSGSGGRRRDLSRIMRRFVVAAGSLQHVIDDFAAPPACVVARVANAEAQPPELAVPKCSMTLPRPLWPALPPSKRSCTRPER